MENFDTKIPLTYEECGNLESSNLILVLHGYAQKKEHMKKIFNQYIEKEFHVVYVNGLFPLPSKFPLETSQKGEDLITGYAWYFYDAQKDEYLVSYETPALALTDLINKKFHEKKINILGYSQGGYLSPFLAKYISKVETMILINCSIRHQFINSFKNVNELIQIQGKDDPIIDTELSLKRFNEFSEKFHLNSQYIMLEETSHRINESIIKAVIASLKL